jgi:hypothetical protein
MLWMRILGGVTVKGSKQGIAPYATILSTLVTMGKLVNLISNV